MEKAKTFENPNWDKVKALAENIISECKQQGFTIAEVDDLIFKLQSILSLRVTEKNQELF